MSTVLGVSLAEGERVYFAEEENTKTARVVTGVIGGVLLLVGLATLLAIIGVLFLGVGGYMLYKALKPDLNGAVGLVLTSQRLLVIPLGPEERVVEHPLSDLEDVDVIREKARSGGKGLAGALVNAAANAYLDHKANKAGKLKPDYWERSKALRLQLSGGRNVDVPVPNKDWGKSIGPMMISGLEHGWGSLHPIQAPAQRQHLP